MATSLQTWPSSRVMLFSLIANVIGGKKADLTLTKSSGAQPWISITNYDKKVMMMLYLVCLLLHVIRTQLESPSVFENCDSQNTCGS